MNGHSLTQIDLAAGTALCSVCGPTEIHVSRPRSGTPPQVSCAQGRNPARRPRHILTELDEQKRSAVCAICGPTDVYQYGTKGVLSYRCATYVRAYERQERHGHIVNPYARVHVLSEIDEEKRTAMCAKCGLVRIEWPPALSSAAGHPGGVPGTRAPRFKSKRLQENTRIVSEYKCRQACRRCGALASVEPWEFHFFELHLPREQRILVLVEKAEPEELVAELEKRDLYCNKCLWLVNKSVANNTPVPEYRPFPTFF